MKIVNEKFIESLKGARNISAILTYNSNKSYRILTNEASENITTELNELLATEKGAYEVKDNQLLRINPSFNVNLFKTVCKSLEIETTENIAANEKINIKIGVKVDEDYQFLNFGNYIVKNSTYQADTDTYLLVAYDKMMESMIKYDDNPLSITYPIEHKNLIIAICEKLNWSYEIDDYINSNAIIDKDLYSGQNLTYRDILDDLLTAVGENLLFDLNDKLVNKKIENSFLSDNIMGKNNLYLKEALESNALEYSIDGKCEQDGTPTPDSPVEIKTIKGIRNLFNGVLFNGYLNNGLVADSKWKTTDYIEVKSNTKYITSYLKNTTRVLYEEYTSKDVSSRVSARKETTPKTAITTQNTTKYIRFSFNDNSLTDKEIMLEQGSVAHSYVPYGTYEKIEVTGKNWFDKDNTYTAIGEVSGYVSSDYIPVKKGDTINKTNSVMFWFYDKSKNQIGFASGSTTTTVSLDNVAYVRCNVLKTDLDTFMLTINQELTDYEPYKEKEVLIDLNIYDEEGNITGHHELSSIGDIKDKLEIINGVVDIQKRIGKVVLNGSENWLYNSSTKIFYEDTFLLNPTPVGTIYKMLCNYFEVTSRTNATNLDYCIFIGTDGKINIKNKYITDKNSFRTWLSENPVTVYYELAEPQQIVLPNTQIPLFDGINHITLVDDLETTTSIIYKKPFIIDDELLKDVNVDFKEKYGPVNSLTISSNNTVINSLEDKKSIEKNGKITFNINDNYLLNYNSDTFINQLFNKIYNLEYYIYDFDSTGILVLEALDKFIVNHNNNNYNCLMLNDDIKLTTGLIETTYAEKPEENEDNYYSVSPQEKKINNALISIDKANAEIVLKVDSNGKIAQARLDGNADKGSKFTIKADNIELEGYSTVNEGFIITTEGNAEVHGSLFDVTNAKNLKNPAVITVRNYNKGQAKGEYFADQIILSNNDGTDIFTVGDGNIGDYHGGVLTLGNDEVDSSITMYDGIINCVEVNQSSLESIKKNFEKLENGLSIVEKADIYKYNLKKENDDDKKHIGLVIGEKYNTPYEVISKNGNSIDAYSMISVAWQCIKELNDKINNLEKEISKLKGESK